jgi:hypothetical protein
MPVLTTGRIGDKDQADWVTGSLASASSTAPGFSGAATWMRIP